MRRTTSALAVAGVLAAAALVGTPASAPAAPARDGRAAQQVHREIDYVALGDSYSAGPLVKAPPGKPTFRPDPQACARSWNNYPAFVADYLDVSSYTDVTCSGAQVADFSSPQGGENPYAAPQLDALSADTDLVTIGIGGNDYGLFGSLVDTCGRLAQEHPDEATPCRDHYTVDGVDTKARDARAIRTRIAGAVAAVHEAAPEADVYVVGYPQLMPLGAHTCDAVGFAAGDVAWGDHIEDLLNRSLRLGATSQDATYVDTQTISRGHDACAGLKAWINGSLVVFTGPKAGANFHPNRAGERGMAKAVFGVVTGRPVSKAPTNANAAPPADAIVLNPAYPG
ncbi:SGNH/GDSL hydrolase family protein [Nocardioides sp.]|uniref:SGNH/GDSL hydrolase family protein n=1 Tax=Nocardioides sp. TaxID=35761 RepID=UPI0037837A86